MTGNKDEMKGGMFYRQKPGHIRFKCEKRKKDKQELIQSLSKPQF